MPYSDPTLPADGFEGFVSVQLDPQPKNARGFEGFILTQGATGYKRPAVAFEGFIIEWSTVIRFIRITDYRGIPVSGVTVTVQNTGGDYSAVTNSDGLAPVEIDIAGTKTILLNQHKTNNSFSYTYASESLTRTVVFMPRLME